MSKDVPAKATLKQLYVMVSTSVMIRNNLHHYENLLTSEEGGYVSTVHGHVQVCVCVKTESCAGAGYSVELTHCDDVTLFVCTKAFISHLDGLFVLQKEGVCCSSASV